jgi:flagella synthesis protein FlgN
MNVPTSIQSVSFEQDAQLVNHLQALLSREQTSLVMVDIDAIDALLEEKAVLLQRINLVAKSRYETLAANGFESSEVGMAAWLKQQAKPAMNESWADFQKALSQAKEMNRLNGMLINKHFNRNQQLLNHLQGNYSAGAVYGRNGQTQSQSASRSVLTA